ncbi:MAG: tetratricopeptide repeat protein, partial [Candidatus Krumholzibacteriota bacterium]|nr:tetratricopeptide repeat protein [Candidatus Krumholzibacteriota bacterium]
VKTDMKLAVVGDARHMGDYFEKVKKIAEGDDRIVFTGPLYGHEKEEAYSNAYVFCHPSDLEGLPLVLLEAMGNDEEAEKKRREWLKDHDNSPLRGEMLLASAWNAIRRDNLQTASRRIEEIVRVHQWLRGDERLELAQAMVAYREGRFAEVTVEPRGSELDAVALYVRALCEIGAGKQLKAAARLQRIIDGHPHSPLREHAMLAKANIFFSSNAYKSAAEEFAVIAEQASQPGIRAEAALRQAAATYLDGDIDAGIDALHQVTNRFDGSDVAARAQMMLGEVLVSAERYEDAILAYNTVLTRYFAHAMAAGAQYRVARCLDALDRGAEATSSYQAVVGGYPTSREAPAAAYLAGVGLFEQGRARAAAPYFQLVLDRYARDKGEGTIEFATPERQELVEAALCLLQLSYHRSGDLGMLSGIPHNMLMRMPASKSTWRAYAMLIDADALASQSRYDEAQASLKTLVKDFAGHDVGAPALQLLAWTYAQQGEIDLAITTQEELLDNYGDRGEIVSSAFLGRAHIYFNEKKYKRAAREYESFLKRYPEHPERAAALYQTGMCYLRLGQDGDAVDRFETLTNEFPAEAIAEKAWLRAGDVYFRAGHYDDAKQSYTGLLNNFGGSTGAALGALRIAQSDYNAGHDAEAIEGFSQVINRFPDHALAEEARAGIEQALYRLGRSTDGETALAELVARFPSSAFAADAQFEIAVRRYDNGDYEDAAEAFRRMITQFPGGSSADRAQYLMADAYSRAGDEGSARLAYEQFMSFFPDSDYRNEVRLRLGVARFASEDYMRAAVDFTAILDDSTSPDIESAALYNLALCRRVLGDDAAALEALEKYARSYPRDEREGEVAHQTAEIYDVTGRTAEAAAAYLRALEAGVDPILKIEVYYRIGACRETLGDSDGAMRAYEGAARGEDRSSPFRLTSVAR